MQTVYSGICYLTLKYVKLGALNLIVGQTKEQMAKTWKEVARKTDLN